MARITPAQQRILDAVASNHIWLNAMQCINPTPEFCEQIGRQVLTMLDGNDNLIPAGGEVGSKLAELTPMLYLRINAS